MASSKVENDLYLPPALIAFELQIVKGHRLNLGEYRVARRVEDFAGDVGFELLLAERDDFEFCKNAMLGDVAVVRSESQRTSSAARSGASMLMRDVSVARAAATSLVTENIPHAARSNSRARSGASTAIPASAV
jgi:hypothetical protein